MPDKKQPGKPSKPGEQKKKLVLNPAGDDSQAVNEVDQMGGVAPEGGMAGAGGPSDVRPHKLMQQMNGPQFGDGGSQEVTQLLEALKQPGVLERLMQLIGGGGQQGGM